jgi:hypothetical protein
MNERSRANAEAGPSNEDNPDGCLETEFRMKDGSSGSERGWHPPRPEGRGFLRRSGSSSVALTSGEEFPQAVRAKSSPANVFVLLARKWMAPMTSAWFAYPHPTHRRRACVFRFAATPVRSTGRCDRYGAAVPRPAYRRTKPSCTQAGGGIRTILDPGWTY